MSKLPDMRCVGMLGRLFGHRFEARYSLGAPTGDIQGGLYGAVEIINATKPKTYIHDVCVRCGKIVCAQEHVGG